MPQQHHLSQQHFGVMLLKNNICCFCCQKLLFLSKPEKNRHHKWKLPYAAVGRQKFRQKFLPEELPLICCQFVISLKSYSWQHMWSSNSIFKNCQKSRFSEIFASQTIFWVQSSWSASDAINDAESNITSLLPIFNKNVVFRHKMLIFHDYSH